MQLGKPLQNFEQLNSDSDSDSFEVNSDFQDDNIQTTGQIDFVQQVQRKLDLSPCFMTECHHLKNNHDSLSFDTLPSGSGQVSVHSMLWNQRLCKFDFSNAKISIKASKNLFEDISEDAPEVSFRPSLEEADMEYHSKTNEEQRSNHYLKISWKSKVINKDKANTQRNAFLHALKGKLTKQKWQHR